MPSSEGNLLAECAEQEEAEEKRRSDHDLMITSDHNAHDSNNHDDNSGGNSDDKSDDITKTHKSKASILVEYIILCYIKLYRS